MFDFRRNLVGTLARVSLAHVVILSGTGLWSYGCANAEIVEGRFEAGPHTAPDASEAGTVDTGPEEAGPAANPMPTLSTVSPAEAEVGAAGPSITVKGTHFINSSVVRLNGTDLTTTYVSDTELGAKIPDPQLAATGTLKVSVFTPAASNGGGGGGESTTVDFNVVNPAPTLTALSPTSALAGSSGTTLTVTGTKFVNGSVVVFDGTDLSTSFTNSTTLMASIPTANLTTPGSYQVTVRNPSPGGGTTTGIAFTVTNPTVTIASISPGSATVGDPNTSLIVSGAGFVSASVVSFNGKALPTTYVSANRIDTVIQASSLATAGTYPVTVTNPAPGGGTSAPANFDVRYPTPKITSISPTTAVTGTGATALTVTGSNFISGKSQIFVNNVALATLFTSSTELKATIPSASLATAGTLQIKVVTADPGGGTSNTVTFDVTNPAPTITTVSPSTIALGAGSTTITVDGTGFYSGSKVRAGSTTLTTTFVSSVKLTATVPSTLLSTAGTLSITVYNATPGGGTSSASTIQVGCDTTDTDVQLSALNVTKEVSPTFDISYTLGKLSSGTCPVSVSTTTNVASRLLIVQNTTAATATLSAWANCTGTASYDAFLTFYRRSTRPTTIDERKACTGVVSEGKSSSVPLAISPETGASNWCPGLTKSNGYGITLAACEKVVVHIQPYSTSATTTYPAPTSVKMKLE